ncbi:MAG: electron transfer flavoprotein subunit beta/FixA family protein [Acidobacteriota bacterium]
MKIVVAVKQVPDTETRIVLGEDGRSIQESNITWIVNPYDEFAVEEALRIKDAQGDSEVIIVTIGPDRAGSALRTCLAMGADRAVHVNDPLAEGSDPLGYARILAAVVQDLHPDLVFTGQYAVGTDNRQTGMMLAELLDMPHVSVVTKLELRDEGVLAHREIEGAYEVVEATRPCVITTQKGLNEPRYASLKGIMAAKKKPIAVRDLAALGIDAGTVGANGAKTRLVRLELPPAKQPGKIFKDDLESAVKEVTRLLHEEARVL